MSEQNQNQQAAGERVSHEPCLCRESWIVYTNALTFRLPCDNT